MSQYTQQHTQYSTCIVFQRERRCLTIQRWMTVIPHTTAPPDDGSDCDAEANDADSYKDDELSDW